MQTDSIDLLGSATYSPEDNKLRFYPDSRLSKADYEKARAAGFKWAPKQELFVAPMWTPEREDLMLAWCGEIGDEDKSLVERQEERAAPGSILPWWSALKRRLDTIRGLA